MESVHVFLGNECSNSYSYNIIQLEGLGAEGDGYS